MIKKEKIKLNIDSILKSKKKTAVLIAVVAAVVVLAGLFCRAALYSGILPNTVSEGIELGGLKKDEAAQLLYARFEERLSESVTLKCGEDEKSFSFSELGISVDCDKTAEDAYSYGRGKGVFAKAVSFLKAVFGGRDIEPCYVADEETVNKVITELAEPYETGVRELGYTLDGDMLTIDKGEGGRMVDRGKVLEQIKEALNNEEKRSIEMIPEDKEPEEVNVDDFYKEVTKPAQNAYYERRDGAVAVVEDVPKIEVEKKTLEKFFKSDDRTVTLKVNTTPAEKTAAQLKKMLFRDVMGSYSSSYKTSTSGRAANVEVSASRINGCILMPGEVFSYDKTIGRRTAQNGFHEAGVYIGNKVEQGIGGGICQTSSTLYSAALYANLEIVQRTSHSLPVSYVPAGQDATIAEGYIDLKIKNNTEYPIKIVAEWGGRHLTCKIVGVKTEGQTVEIINTKTGTKQPKITREYTDAIPQGYKKISQKGAAGYTVASKRIVRQNGKVIKEEKLKGSVYNATDTIEQINPADKDTPSESLAVYTGVEQTAEPSYSAPAGSLPIQNPSVETVSPQTPAQPENEASENETNTPTEGAAEAEKPSEGAGTPVSGKDNAEQPTGQDAAEKPSEPETISVD